jgi:hypothetical protein
MRFVKYGMILGLCKQSFCILPAYEDGRYP